MLSPQPIENRTRTDADRAGELPFVLKFELRRKPQLQLHVPGKGLVWPIFYIPRPPLDRGNVALVRSTTPALRIDRLAKLATSITTPLPKLVAVAECARLKMFAQR
jgi:hypothetical protein